MSKSKRAPAEILKTHTTPALVRHLTALMHECERHGLPYEVARLQARRQWFHDKRIQLNDEQEVKT